MGAHGRSRCSGIALAATAMLGACGPPPAPEAPSGTSSEAPAPQVVAAPAPPAPALLDEPAPCLPGATAGEPVCEGTLGTASTDAAARAERLMVEGQALSEASDLRGCGRVYLEAAVTHPSDVRAADGAYQAARCLFEALSERALRSASLSRRAPRRARREESFERRPLDDLEEQALRAADRFLCLVPEGGDDAIAVAYRRARIFYMANQLVEAAHAFRRIAFDYPEHEIAEYAANLYLDCLNVIGTRDEGRRAPCRSALISEARELAELYCSAEARGRHDELCYTLDSLLGQAR